MERALDLAIGLTALPIRSGDTAAIVFCKSHEADQTLARRAIEHLDLRVLIIPPEDLAASGDGGDAAVILACPEGTDAWRTRSRRGILLGDAPGETWWKMIELGGRRSRRSRMLVASLSEARDRNSVLLRAPFPYPALISTPGYPLASAAGP